MTIIQTTRDFVLYALPHMRGRLLDFGAGTSKYQPIILPHVQRYTAFDAKEAPHIDVVGDVEVPPFSDGSFETVLCNQVLEHVPHPQRVVSAIARLLVRGG